MYNIANKKKTSVKFNIVWLLAKAKKKGLFFLYLWKQKKYIRLEAGCSFGGFFPLLLFKIELDSNPPFFIFDRKKSFSTSECKV